MFIIHYLKKIYRFQEEALYLEIIKKSKHHLKIAVLLETVLIKEEYFTHNMAHI